MKSKLCLLVIAGEYLIQVSSVRAVRGGFDLFTGDICIIQVVVVVALLFYVHDKHLRSCRDGQLT